MKPLFVHLHLHSEYALQDSTIRIKALPQAVSALDMPAVAITDPMNLFALVKFAKAASSKGIKPIAGAEVYFPNAQPRQPPLKLVLLCLNRVGYRNLCHLLGRAYQEGQHQGQPCLRQAWLAGHSEGLLALSGGREGDIGQALLADNLILAEALLRTWRQWFPQRFYLELQRTGRAGDETHVQRALELAERSQTPVVATNDVRFLRREDFEAHEARQCIAAGSTLADPNRPRLYSEQQYLRSPEEMHALFADIPEALQNSVEIAKRCNLSLKLGQSFLPDFPLPPGLTVADYLRQEARQGLALRLAQLNPAEPETYHARLELELDVIIQMGFPGYFLIVADFIRWAKQQGIPVGPGRGSGAGSLVAYALQITDLDPLAYDLLFERFLNPERVSMPDFDVDFCMEGRDRVIDYVAERYGRDRVSQIITYGSMAAKAVVRDVGRVLGHPYGFVDSIAKLIPFELGMTLDKALTEDAELQRRYQQEDEVHELINLARSLEGLPRNAGKHAGGVVIAPTMLTDFAPLYCETGGEGLVTQFDKDDVEAIGLVKFDFLGLKTLTIIDWALRQINTGRLAQGPLDLNRIPLDDPKTFELLKRCKTTAVFQLESRGMKDLVRRLQPDCFEDIIALVALFRPGPLQSGMVDDFIDRKHGKAEIEYLHPELQDNAGIIAILKPTYGVIVYQEQVMQLAQVLAGYTLGGADLLRRAMGKKKPEEMAKQRSTFVAGAVSQGIRAETAGYVFDLVEKFAGYGFNKSHSAAYALLSYQTAYLKAHYPAEFLAAVLTSAMADTDEVVNLLRECRQLNVVVDPPDINQSRFGFSVQHGRIRYGLGAIKGVGEAALGGLLQVRDQGRFSDIHDLCLRGTGQKLTRRVLEALLKAGALDSLNPNRAQLQAQLEPALQWAAAQSEQRALNQGDIFSLDADGRNRVQPPEIAVQAPWPLATQLAGEKETLGIYLSGHPCQIHLAALNKLTPQRLGDLQRLETRPGKGQRVVAAGLAASIRRHTSAKRGAMAVVQLEDHTGELEAVLFGEAVEQYGGLLREGSLLVAEGNLSFDPRNDANRVLVDKLLPLEQATAQALKCIHLSWVGSQRSVADVTHLRNLLEPHCGGRCNLIIHYQGATACVELQPGAAWRLHPSTALLEQLRAWLGPAETVWAE